MELKFNLVFDPKVPQILKEQVLVLFAEHQDLVPKWIEELSIDFCEESDGKVITNKTETHYRRALLTFRADFIVLSEQQRLRFFIHDLLHCFHSGMYYQMCEMIEKVLNVTQEELKDVIIEQLWRENEACTEDLTSMVFRLKGLDKTTGKKKK